jgi:hypothetical protein
MPRFHWAASGAPERKVESNDLESQVNQCNKLLGGDEAVIVFSVDFCGSASGFEIPAIS